MAAVAALPQFLKGPAPITAINVFIIYILIFDFISLPSRYRKMEHAGILADIMSQLTQAAELVLSGDIPEALFTSVICGAPVLKPVHGAGRVRSTR